MKDLDKLRTMLDAGQYKIFVGTQVVSQPFTKILFEDLVRKTQYGYSIINQITPKGMQHLVPIVISESPISVILVDLGSSQGSLFSNQDLIEETARDEADEKINLAIKSSIDAIDVGNDIAFDLTEDFISAEELNQRLQESPDETISRRTIHKSRGDNVQLTFRNSTRNIGGNLNVPKDVFSDKKFCINNCRVLRDMEKGKLKISIGEDNHPSVQDLLRSNAGVIYSDPESTDGKLIRYSNPTKASFDVEVCIAERIKDQQANLVLTQVLNRASLFKVIADDVQQMEEDLNDFG